MQVHLLKKKEKQNLKSKSLSETLLLRFPSWSELFHSWTQPHLQLICCSASSLFLWPTLMIWHFSSSLWGVLPHLFYFIPSNDSLFLIGSCPSNPSWLSDHQVIPDQAQLKVGCAQHGLGWMNSKPSTRARLTVLCHAQDKSGSKSNPFC